MTQGIIHRARDLEDPSPFDLSIESFVKEGWSDDEIADWIADLDEGKSWAPRRYWVVRIAAIRAAARVGVSEPDYNGLTRTEILAARHAHEAEGHTSEAIHKRLLISRSTLNRARRRLGLMPWPDQME